MVTTWTVFSSGGAAGRAARGAHQRTHRRAKKANPEETTAVTHGLFSMSYPPQSALRAKERYRPQHAIEEANATRAEKVIEEINTLFNRELTTHRSNNSGGRTAAASADEMIVNTENASLARYRPAHPVVIRLLISS